MITDDLKQDKRKLEQSILNLIENFEAKYRISVYDIELKTCSVFHESGERKKVDNIKVTCVI